MLGVEQFALPGKNVPVYATGYGAARPRTPADTICGRVPEIGVGYYGRGRKGCPRESANYTADD